MCIFQPFTEELHSCSYVSQSTVIGFRKRCFVLVHSEVCCGSVRFGSLNTLLTLPVEKDCVGKAKPRARGAKPVTLFLLNEI